MKNVVTKSVVVGVIATAMAGAAVAAEVSITADFASAYVFRGATLNDGFVFQPGIEVGGFPIPEKAGGVTIGVWGNYDIDDYGGSLESSEFSEIDWYISYALPISVIDVSIGYCEYAYGGSSDKEFNVGVGKSVGPVGLAATAYYGTDGAVENSLYLEFGAEYGLTITEGLDLSLGASIGYLEPDSGESGFNDGNLSAGISYTIATNWTIGASIAYIAQLDDDVLMDVDAGGTYDVDVVGMLSIGCSF